MTDIRSEILRQYYEINYGKQIPSANSLKDATFEEYYALTKIAFPDISRWKAAQRSRRPDFQKLVETFEPDPPRHLRSAKSELSYKKRFQIRRINQLDLKDSPFEDGIKELLLDRIKSISGFEKLQRLNELEKLMLILSNSDEEKTLKPAVKLTELHIKSCNTVCTKTVLSSTSANNVVIEHLDDAVFDLMILRGHTQLKNLRVYAGLVRGLKYLQNFPVERLVLSNIKIDDELRKFLSARKETLTYLGIGNEEAFHPKELPALLSIRQIKIPGYDKFRNDWIDFAVQHSSIKFEFYKAKESFSKLPNVKISEIYRGVDILRIQKDKKEHFEIWGNLVGDVLNAEHTNNHDLADKLRKLAKNDKKRIKIWSSADEINIISKQLEICKWCIDKVFEIGKHG